MAIVAANLDPSIGRLAVLSDVLRRAAVSNSPHTQAEIDEIVAIIALLKAVQLL